LEPTTGFSKPSSSANTRLFKLWPTLADPSSTMQPSFSAKSISNLLIEVPNYSTYNNLKIFDLECIEKMLANSKPIT